MTPKPVLYSLEKNILLNKTILEEIKTQGFTRIPVFETNEDNIIGILYAKDLIGLFNETKTVADFLTDKMPIRVKDSILLDTLLNHFIQQKIHIATVYDTFGTFIGIATLEDIIEEIIRQEIVDEVDRVTDLQHLAVEQSQKLLIDN